VGNPSITYLGDYDPVTRRADAAIHTYLATNAALWQRPAAQG
jgi:hypothetical protein